MACDYPPPPDRKLLAAQRWQNAKARARAEAAKTDAKETKTSPTATQGVTTRSDPPIRRASTTSKVQNMSRSSHGTPQSRVLDNELRIMSPPTTQMTTYPNAEVADFLIDLFFSHQIAGDLLFHKKSFKRDLGEKKIPDFVLLSVFAAATIYLRRPNSPRRRELPEDLLEVGDSTLSARELCEQGRVWAEIGTQRVLAQCDVWRIETIQALANFQLYWFSVGEVARTYLHNKIAYLTAQNLKLDAEQPPSTMDDASRMQAEINRRTYWVAWLQEFVTASTPKEERPPWTKVVGLLFPCDADEFENETPRPMHRFNEKGLVESIAPGTPGGNMSTFGAMFLSLSLWTDVRRFETSLGDMNDENVSELISTFLNLDSKLSVALDRLGPNFRQTSSASFASSEVDASKIFFIHSLHRLCALSLHASLVPVFSNISPSTLVPKKLVHLSAEEVVKHAALTLDMATAFMNTNPDVSRLPSAAAYSMFVAVTLHFKSLVAQRKLHASSMGRFKAALYIIDILGDYWATSNGLWTKLSTLFSEAGFDITALVDSPSLSEAPPPDDQPPDIERIVSSKDPPQASTSFSEFAPYPNNQNLSRRPPPLSSISNLGSRIDSPPSKSPRIQNILSETPRGSRGSAAGGNPLATTISREGPPSHFQPPQPSAQQPPAWAHFHTPNLDASLPHGYPRCTPTPGPQFSAPSQMQALGNDMEIDPMNSWWDQQYDASLFEGNMGERFDGRMMDGSGYSTY
ncbi:hypothetical protein BJ875DRAFT_481590 [Amylocarpus encephaloides]|uniref:Transcription factor domain-containing protein n=1 Tax=Amylocarpus encephaloides TaxID=45428 RepID=A0A9P8C7U3_9HELO|nr:hypothetical protein BJ875DRAFT_481590 [Amylocarpus encephaloides]